MASSFRKNFAVLLLLQVSTYAVPLLTLPLLTRVLTPEGYGRLAFALAFINYFIVLTNYGFGLTATPQISVNRANREERSRVFWSTLCAQGVVTIGGFTILLTLSFVFDRLAQDRELLLLGFGLAVGAMLTPTWYFQGIEDLRITGAIVFASRVLSVPAMYLLVHSRDDIYWAMGVNSLVPLMSGLTIMTYLYFRRELDFVSVSLDSIAKSLKDGWSVFLATAINEYSASSNTVLLALISGNVAAGYFAAGDKLIRAAIGIMSPLKTAAYPRISYLMHHSRDAAFSFLRKMLAFQGTVVALISLTIFTAAPLAVKLLYGPHYQPTVDVLRLMAFVPFLSGIADVFGVQTMLPLGMKSQFGRVLLGAAVLNVALLTVLSTFFAELGAATALLTVQAYVAIAMATTLYMQRVPFFLKQGVPE
ncbi:MULTISPECIES: oligosaccharide flippase family protein [unclassified Caballeronia]|jgi:PST family polysaccharide transporter|uniref:oligosaccharide flippase family protein n=1 Tax=unclassified Caballeronia TaxID=2646786 RepID=UPI0020284849|nr:MULTISPECIES: oligosaccharide flippase family protein [unclassified Caballeronia]MDR5774452.1 oligosaccharide flippase family protein [Caballeronia sp. LZ002]MDR5805983.1 oligosaccharide flippase family protein [Caballeronia sp. LZ001]MDR5849887.1 oligosaccharide flippase family protein [Caballeronia sp. LZ003]